MGYRKEDHMHESIPEFGAIFMSNSATRKECFERKLLGLPSGKGSFVKQIKAGMALFLFEFEKRELHGVFRACSDGAMNIVPNAFSSSGMQFPAQVRFAQIWRCSPLREHEFRDAIRENYFTKYKFHFGLSEDQVRRLLILFKSRRLDTNNLIHDDQRVAATNLGTGDSRFLKSDATENELNDQRREYDSTMEHSRTSLHKRKRYNDGRLPIRDDIYDHDVSRGLGRNLIHDTADTIYRSGREGEDSEFSFAPEYGDNSVSKVRKAGQDGSFLTGNIIEEQYFADSGRGLVVRAGFENPGDKDRRTNDEFRSSMDRRAETDHYLDPVPGAYFPGDYHGSPLGDVRKTSGHNLFRNDRSEVEQIEENGIGYPGNTLEKVRRACSDDGILIGDRVETARHQFVHQPDIEWKESGHGKFWGDVYSENDGKVDHGFEEDMSTFHDGNPLDEVRHLRGEGILPNFDRMHDEYTVKNSPRPRENLSFCSSNTISQTDFSFGPYQSKPYSGLLSMEELSKFSHSTSYDTVPTRTVPYEPKILDIHHRRTHVADNSSLPPVEKYSPHHSFIETSLFSLAKQTSPCHLEAEDPRYARGSCGNNSLFQNYPSHETRLTSLENRTSPFQDEDPSRRPNLDVSGGPYDSEIIDSHGKYSSYGGDNSILQQIQDFPPNVSSIASNLVSSMKQSSPYHLQGEDPSHQLSDTFHQFQSCHRPPSVRTSNSLLGSEYYSKMETKSSFGQYRDVPWSGPSVSMPSTSAGITDYKSIQHETNQMSGFKDATAAEGESYLHRNLSSEHPGQRNSKSKKSSEDSSGGHKRSNRTSVFDRLTSGSELHASDDTRRGYDNCDTDASVDQVMETLYQSLNHPGVKKAKATSVVSQHNRELPWLKPSRKHPEVSSDKPVTMLTETKNETNQVIDDGDNQIREETRVVEFKRRSSKKVQDSTNPKSSVQNVEIKAAASSVQIQGNEGSDGKVVVNKKRKLVRPVFGKKEQLNDGFTSNGDSNLQFKSPEPLSKKETGGSGDSVKIHKVDNHPSSLDPLVQLTLPTYEMETGRSVDSVTIHEDDNHPLPLDPLVQLTRPTCESNNANENQRSPESGNAELVEAVFERKGLREGAIGDKTTNQLDLSHVDADSTSTKVNNTGSSEKEGFQNANSQHSSHVDADSINTGSSEKDCFQPTNSLHLSHGDGDSSTKENNIGSSEKDGFPQSVDLLQVSGMSGGETSQNNAISVDLQK